MRLSHVVALAAIVGTCCATFATAKSLQEGSSPVNFPPEDFTGGSFVDNDGCIYIRAGVDGSTTWVPRVSRNRQLICNRKPTFGDVVQAEAPDTQVEEPAVEQAPVAAAAAAPAAPAAPTAPVTAQTRPQPRQASAAASAAPKATTVQQPAAAPVQTATATVTSVLPPVPEGYKRAWTDGRLNPQRGIPDETQRTATIATRGVVSPIDGRRYDLAWSDYLPRLLFDRNTGMVVGDKFPGMIYPNLDPTRAVPQATISAKSPSPFMTRTIAKRHIQAATYNDMAKAQAAAQRLANAGLPTRIGKYTQNGEARQVIVVGPFSTNGDVKSALEATVRLGFSRAFPRK